MSDGLNAGQMSSSDIKNNKNLSPMMRHWCEVKASYPDCVIFYRLGDFYEMFFEDAREVSDLLDITLTGRDCGLSSRADMCGVPYHAAESYLAKLISAGKRVAICEQTQTPEETGGKIVEREVIRVVTEGTVTDDAILNEKQNNYLASVFVNDKRSALVWTDISTGELYSSDFETPEQLFETLENLSPSEIIATENTAKIYSDSEYAKRGRLPKFRTFNDNAYKKEYAAKRVATALSENAVQIYDLVNREEIIASAGALFEYLEITQKRALSHITAIKMVNRDDFMQVDANTRRNLEIFENIRDRSKKNSLLGVLDKCRTSMGSRLFRRWLETPLKNENTVNVRLKAVEELVNNSELTAFLEQLLRKVGDIERLSGKIAMKEIKPNECLTLMYSISMIPEIKTAVSALKGEMHTDISNRLTPLDGVAQLLFSAINPEATANMKDGGYIKKGFNADLDNYRAAKFDGKVYLADLESRERELTGIKTLKVGYNRIFGYYIEVTNAYKDKIPDKYVRKQTLAGAERFVTEELKTLENTILSAEDNSLRLETQIYETIRAELVKIVDVLKKNALAIAELDCLRSFSQIAIKNRYVKPDVSQKHNKMEIIAGRHPVLETIVTDGEFIANDTCLNSDEQRTIILTGPNMAGKSTYMRQTALIVFLAQIGSFVPATKATLPIFDKIFTRVGAGDDLATGQSTFMTEMLEVATILANATKDSLIILDEIGRGTSTCDGLSIAWAVLETINNDIKAKTLFSTHYHELAGLEGLLSGIKNYKVLVRETDSGIIFLHKIVRGSVNKSFGIEVATLAGVGEKVTARARQIAREIEKEAASRDTHSLVLAGDVKNLKNAKQLDFFQEENKPNETEMFVKSLDINSLSPIQALQILSDLKGNLK